MDNVIAYQVGRGSSRFGTVPCYRTMSGGRWADIHATLAGYLIPATELGDLNSLGTKMPTSAPHCERIPSVINF